MAAREAADREGQGRLLRRLFAAVRRVDASGRPLKGGKKMVDPELWRELLAAARELEGG
jgi:hypothetical protein